MRTAVTARGSIALGVLGALALSLTACKLDVASRDNLFVEGESPYVVCGLDIDDKYGVADQLDEALARAEVQHATLHLYGHDPGGSLALSELESLLADTVARGMEFVTYKHLGTGGARGSLALAFDDNAVADWTKIRPLLAKYGAHVTFFVTRYLVMTPEEHQQLHDLASDGHDIEFHTVAHLNAVDYSAQHGVDGWVADEITPALDAMINDGFDITEFAYPFGARNDATDKALEPYFIHLRAISSTCPRH